MNHPTVVDEQTCWYKDYVVDEMNRFFDKHLKNQDITKHFAAFTELINLTDEQGSELIDLGCGTAMLNIFCKNYKYIGADLAHIISGCAMRNYPDFFYRACDLTKDDLSWIKKYKVAVVNGVIDIMQYPLEMLDKVLSNCSKYLIIHRQEITEAGHTHTKQNGSYGGVTYHSIISRKDFMDVLERNHFDVVKENRLEFGNWENGGSSFLLRKRKTWALYEMDYKLNDVFKGKQNGFFIEAGANDGLTQSNTMYLEFYKNWNGILIEPISPLFHQCTRNRSSRNEYGQFALVEEFIIRPIEMIYTLESNGLLSVIKDENSAKMMKRTKEKGHPVEVRASSLNRILETVQPEHIDLLVLDIEGYEMKALRGCDFEKWKIDYLLIEELEENMLVSDYLSPWYDRVDKLSEHDYLYKRKN